MESERLIRFVLVGLIRKSARKGAKNNGTRRIIRAASNRLPFPQETKESKTRLKHFVLDEYPCLE